MVLFGLELLSTWLCTCRPKDALDVVQLELISQLFFFGMATVFVVAIFFMVTDIKLG